MQLRGSITLRSLVSETSLLVSAFRTQASSTLGKLMDIDAHRATPYISIERHTKQRQIELGRSLDGRFPLYLDVNYWIALRKAETGIGNEAENELLRRLRQLTGSGKVFCPISESVLIELMKQQDQRSRIHTAQLIDDLSSGVSLIAFDARAATELAHFVNSYMYPSDSLYPLRHLIWLKASYALGIAHPSPKGLDEETQLALQKAFFDEIWSMSVTDVVKTVGQAPAPDTPDLSDLAAALNANNAAHAQEIRSFAQAYLAEARGVASAFAGQAFKISQDLSLKHGEPVPRFGSDDWLWQRKIWENLLFHVLQKEERNKLPSMHVHACLHAAYRWDKGQKFEANDFYDFHHASAALAFCRAFFTERSLRFTITANHVALDKLYKCDVIAGIANAVDYLTMLHTD
jgi:hypothetical protein